MNRAEEMQGKVNKVRALLQEKGVQGMLTGQQSNFSWITAGGRGFLGLASVNACAQVLVTHQDVFLLSNNIESGRLMEEELLGLPIKTHSVPWQQDSQLGLAAQQLADGAVLQDTQESAWFLAQRTSLQDEEVSRFRALCAEHAQAVEGVMFQLTSSVSEFEVAGAVSEALWKRGIEPISLFIAADDRISSVRHFIPTQKKAIRQIAVSGCARRHGLVSSMTRMVSFGAPSTELKVHHEKLLQVEAAGWTALTPGSPLSDAYQAMCRMYQRLDMPQEWNNHHQGGVTGYQAREVRMQDQTDFPVARNQVFAFNPSCPYAKTEDMVLLGKEGIELLTSPTPMWPTMQAAGHQRADILVL